MKKIKQGKGIERDQDYFRQGGESLFEMVA